ncbi:uncharacterized protein LOC124276589 [Haliotis rubra]|uniref:uncharacterized protein LOC124276589 n=1 Tax=Haliotis rubra TaxID=36100 RepID=UPI001EE56A0A|nr:uncharacterized protein LOC124276589 [Haliotis rubra]
MKSLCLITISVLVLHVVAEDMPCRLGRHCPRDMCCKGNTGRSQGSCTPLKTEGEECRMYSGLPSWGQYPVMVRECRCHDDFYCAADHPGPQLGGRGTCRPWGGLP